MMTGGHHGSGRIPERSSSYEGGQTPKPCPATWSVLMNTYDWFFFSFFLNEWMNEWTFQFPPRINYFLIYILTLVVFACYQYSDWCLSVRCVHTGASILYCDRVHATWQPAGLLERLWQGGGKCCGAAIHGHANILCYGIPGEEELHT